MALREPKAVTMYLHTYSVIPIIITGSILSTGLKGEESKPVLIIEIST